MPVNGSFPLYWSFAARHTFGEDTEVLLEALDSGRVVQLQLQLADQHPECPYLVSGELPTDFLFSGTAGWALTSTNAKAAHVIDLQSLCENKNAGQRASVISSLGMRWFKSKPRAVSHGQQDVETPDVVVVMNPLHPFTTKKHGETAAAILVYHIKHHLCFGVTSYIMYVEEAQVSHLLLSEGIRDYIAQGRLHLVLWDKPGILTPPQERWDAYGVPMKTGMHFWQSIQYNHALLLLKGQNKYALFIDPDEYLSAHVSHILQHLQHPQSIIILQQVQMTGYGLSSNISESELWQAKGPASLLKHYVGHLDHGNLKTAYIDSISVLAPLYSHIKCFVHAAADLTMHNHAPFGLFGNNTKTLTVSPGNAFLAHFMNLWRHRSGSQTDEGNKLQNDKLTLPHGLQYNFCGL